jgi:predicted MFS family arabinose efflux permease
VGTHREIFALASLAMAASFLLALRLPPRPEVRVRVPWLPREVIRNNAPAYVAMLLRHTGAAAVWIIFPLYLQQLGAGPLEIGVLYFLNTGSQFVFMGFLDRYRPGPLVVGGLLASSAVFMLFYAAPVWWLLVPVQLLLALSWALLYVGALAWVMERNVERATSTGLLQSTTSLANVLGPALGGAVAHAAGYDATMVLAAFLSLAAVPVFLASARRQGQARPAGEVVLQPPAAGDETGISPARVLHRPWGPGGRS